MNSRASSSSSLMLMDDALDASITLAVKAKTKAFNRGILTGLIKTSILIKKCLRQSEKDMGNRAHSDALLMGKTGSKFNAAILTDF